MSVETESSNAVKRNNEPLIRNRSAFVQKIVFDGLTFGDVSPTDIDLHLDFRGILSVYGEIKYRGTEVPRGQELSLEREVDSARKGGKRAIAIIAEHETPCDQDIRAADAIVRRYYNGRRFKEWTTGDEFCGLSLCEFFSVTLSRDRELRKFLPLDRQSRPLALSMAA